MKQKQKNFKFPPITIQQLLDLKEKYGSETRAAIVGIDRLHKQECVIHDQDNNKH
jgi:hypothetical protein